MSAVIILLLVSTLKHAHETSIFNPRSQKWSDHFIWTSDGLNIIGITPIGRATCNRLDVNDDYHNQGFIKESRQLWIQGGWHPPIDDPRLSS